MEELLGLKQPVPLEKPRGFNPYMDNSGTIIGISPHYILSIIFY